MCGRACVCVCVCINALFSEPCVSFSVCFSFLCVMQTALECEVCLCDAESLHSPSHRHSLRFTYLPFSFPLSVFIIRTENSHLLTIQPDLTTTTTSYQGTLRSRHDTAGKFSMTNGPLLDPLPNGSHTLHNGKLNSDTTEFVSRLSTQTYFKTLPRDVANTSYGTFNFLGGRLTIPNTGGFFIYVVLPLICLLRCTDDLIQCPTCHDDAFWNHSLTYKCFERNS